MAGGRELQGRLEREDAINKWREVMGATNPENADEGTIRKMYAVDLEKNSVHGSDAPETAMEEKAFFFSGKMRSSRLNKRLRKNEHPNVSSLLT